MPQQKDLKRVVRTRMRKTGESYTTARLHVLGKRDAAATKSPAKTQAAAKPAVKKAAAPMPAAKKMSTAKKRAAAAKQRAIDYAALAGLSDETIAAKTGCTWERWVGHLDHWGAADKPHREIADHVHEKFGVPGWWAQTVTVGYERIKGLRAIGQRRGGAYETTKSKTVAVPVEQLFAAFADETARKRWLPGIVLSVRMTPHKSVRFKWNDGTLVVAGFAAKGANKSMVAIQHSKLPDAARAAELKLYWGERLDSLAEQLAGGG
jgi:hypothetical protein